METQDLPPIIKTLELDKICRVCLNIKKEMRPLFGELMADMLMDCTQIQVDNTDGWPDKICIQCVHQVSRSHAFKTRVVKSDSQLRQYIKGLTVIVEEPVQKISVHHSALQPHHRTPTIFHPLSLAEQLNRQVQLQVQQSLRQDIHHNSNDVNHIHNQQSIQPATPQMIITNNGHAQLINANQLMSTAQGQQIAHAVQAAHAGGGGQNMQLCQLVQTGNGTMQMIHQNGQPTQLVQIQRTADDRCEIIVQPDMQSGQTHYYTEDDLKNLVRVTTQSMHKEDENLDDNDVQLIEEIEEMGEFEEMEEINEIEEIEEVEELEELDEVEDVEEVDCDQMIEHISEELEEEDEQSSQIHNAVGDAVYTVDLDEDDSVDEDREYIAEFISKQTSCPYPGKFICNLCRQEFKYSRWLQTHMKSHSNWIKANCKKQPQCHICQRSFKGPGMLKMHMKTHEKPPEKAPSCKICHKVFKSKTILYRHRQTHLEKLVQCGHCDKTFCTVSTLQMHLSKTNHEKIFKCTHCNKVYPSANSLKIHVQETRPAPTKKK